MNRLARLDEPDDALASPALGFRSAEKVFANGKRGLAPIDLKIAAGEFVSLIGPSGCGKSTLLKLAANLIEPSDGRMLWWQDDFASVGKPGRRLAFVFQEPTLMPWARVEANVALPLAAAGVARTKARAAAQAALRLVGLEAFGGYFPGQLSGGMRMRVSIARALVVDPQLLLMDEPFGALDELTRNALDEELAALVRSRGCTTLFVTHSISEAVFLSSRVVVMAADPGRVFADVEVKGPAARDAAFRDSDAFFAQCRALSALLARASAATREAGR
jgi:NitT/TauT family transport system ATP-binding protein